MGNAINEISEHERIFQEDIQFAKKAKHVAKQYNLEAGALMVEYKMLVERYDKLLKTTLRIAKIGDKAQKKLIRYKELLETLQNID